MPVSINIYAHHSSPGLGMACWADFPGKDIASIPPSATELSGSRSRPRDGTGFKHHWCKGKKGTVLAGTTMNILLRRLLIIFWPVSTRNYYLWPYLFLIPLMIGDVVTTTIAIRMGYPELNPLLVNIVGTPLHHLALKITIPLLLLILCIALYSMEGKHYTDGHDAPGSLFGIIKFSIFIIIVIDCIIYAGAFLSNTRLIIDHTDMLRTMSPPSG